MENTFRFPFSSKKGVSSEKESALLQAVIVISSGILSSSTIAVVLKAWLDTRKTRLTIQIDGDRKTLEYEGLYFSQDASTLQHVVEKLSEPIAAALPVDVVVTPLTDDEQTERKVLDAGRNLDTNTHQDGEQVIPRQQHSFLKQRLPLWLQRSIGSTIFIR